MGLGPAALRCLRDMLADPHEVDIVREGRSAYCGNRPISGRTVNALLRCLAIDGQLVEGCQRFTVKESVASQIIERPALADEIVAMLMSGGGNFQIEGGRVIPLGQPAPPAETPTPKGTP